MKGPPFIFGAVVVLGLALGWPFLAEAWEEPSNHARIVSAVFTTLGTLVSAIVGVLLFNRQQGLREADRDAQLARERADEERKHAGFLLKLGTALRAEIQESLERLDGQYNDEAVVAALKQHRETLQPSEGSDQPRLPVGVALEENPVFDAHQDRIYELPEQVIRTLTRYYQNDRYVNRYLASMSEGAFNGLDLNRKKRALETYYEVVQDTARAAFRALALLNAFVAMQRGLDREKADKAGTLMNKPVLETDDLSDFLEGHDFEKLENLERIKDSRRDAYNRAIGVEDA